MSRIASEPLSTLRFEQLPAVHVDQRHLAPLAVDINSGVNHLWASSPEIDAACQSWSLRGSLSRGLRPDPHILSGPAPVSSKGANPKQVQSHLGHSSITLTMDNY